MDAGTNLIVHSTKPYNAEPPLARLRSSFLTRRGDFYVRSHGGVPELDAGSYRLRVDGKVTTKLDLSLAEIRALAPHRTLAAVLQCAGNRRADLQPVRPTSGDPWAAGAIGNAEWTGIALSAVLGAAGLGAPSLGGPSLGGPGHDLHVAFASADELEMEGSHFRYGASIPLAKALHPDVLLAWAMNGQDLAPEHGFPLRVVVPGYAGVRSPKWLISITVQDRPSDNPVQRTDYKLLPADVSKETVDWERGITINDMPLNSAICEPAPHARLAAGPTMVRGYAIATERRIARVDVSIDGGRGWTQAKLESDPATPWSWTFWEAAMYLPAGDHELVVRAWDDAGQTQPAQADDVWNFKGYLSAAWHRVRITAE